MEKKKIHMIGNTHIDPVWLWNRAEGMQEVKSSFMSALDRMEEFEDFKFTQSSISYLEWMKENCPRQFARIRERVAEGRWEIVGGMWVEPDCNLPSGESLIRHFLYGCRSEGNQFVVSMTTTFYCLEVVSLTRLDSSQSGTATHYIHNQTRKFGTGQIRDSFLFQAHTRT